MATTYGARAVDFPDVFKSPLLQRFEPYPIVSGTAYSSHAPASFFFHPVVAQVPLIISNVNVFKSLAVGVPGATSQASTGSEAYSYSHGISLFQRQDYGANSTNLSALATASFGLSASMRYSSTSQVFGFSFLTDSSGGLSTFSTSSADAGWSTFVATMPVRVGIPFVTILSAGEYWLAHAHSSTTATSNSNVTLLSVSNLHMTSQGLISFGALGGQATVNSWQGGIGLGVASAVTTSTTMAASVVSTGTVNLWVQNYSAA